MILRYLYACRLAEWQGEEAHSLERLLHSRSVTPDDREGLANLMQHSYAGSVDDQNGSVEDANVEVDNFLMGIYGPPLLEISTVVEDRKDGISSAILVTRWGPNNFPLIAFAMTHPEEKGKGIASILLRQSLRRMKEGGEKEVRAVITDGNDPSIRLFESAGFKKIDSFRMETS